MVCEGAPAAQLLEKTSAETGDTGRQQAQRVHVRIVAVHAREADDDVAALLRAAPAVTVVLHSFSSGLGLLRAGLALPEPAYVSFSGMITFKNWTLDDAIRETPLDRLLCETDGPYLAPVPHRGSRNEPRLVRHVAERLAAVRGMPVDHLVAVVAENAARAFGETVHPNRSEEA